MNKPLRTSLAALLWRCITLVLLAIFGEVGFERCSSAQTPSGTQSRRLAIEHLPRDVAAVKLQQALAREQQAAEVFLDSRSASLIIRADAATQTRAADLWRKLDAPVNRAPRILLVSALKNAHDDTHSLRHVSPEDLQRLLLATWPKLRFESKGNDDLLEARLPGEEPAVLGIDYRARTVKLSGNESAIAPWKKVISALDASTTAEERPTLMPLQQADPAQVAYAVSLLGKSNTIGATQPPVLRFIAQNQPAAPPEKAAPEVKGEQEGEGPIGPVTIEILEGLDVIVVRGKKRDVERVQKIIADIERQSQETSPEIEVHALEQIDGRAAAELIAQIYDQVFGARQSRVSITPLIKPNALLLIGRKEGVAALKELLAKLDQPISPESQLKVFPLKHAAAVDVEKTVRNFFVQRAGIGTEERTGLGTRVNVIADFRANALIVQASPRDLLEVAALVERLDVSQTESSHEMRIFRLKNSLAEDLAPVLQEAITGQRATGGAGGAAAAGATTSSQAARPNLSLQLLQIDGEGRRMLDSGILSSVKITADPRGNALLITGPSQSMELIGMMIEQLDALPSAEAQMKVFTLVNGDAQTLVTALQQLFGQSGNQQGGQLPLQTATGGGDSTLVPLRFTVDQRTNSVIASGSMGDLEVVERLLVRLDESDVRRRKTTVYRLRNAPALDVSTAINQFLQNQRQVNQLQPNQVGQAEQIEREVVVVPERVSNSLLVSATPRYFEEIQQIVDDLDKRPPMVMIQVLIAEVTLENLDEFGVELGLQDSLLFDRGIGNNANGTNTVGFPFNTSAIGNSNSTQSLATRNAAVGQALGNLAVGRSNAALGYGGLVLSASSDSVSVLLRALQRSHRLQVVSRPQVQTLDNQAAFVQIGSQVPYIANSNITSTGLVQNTPGYLPVGILLGVTPRTSPDGLIVMEINAEKSEVGPQTNIGNGISSPQIFTTKAQTTVSARTGQTVILGGLITKNRDQETRRVPYLSDIPLLGRLFRYDMQTQKKTELMIIMTPYVMRTDDDIEAINARESERMHWCLADVAEAHGELPWTQRGDPANAKPTPVIFPDENSTGLPTNTPPATTAPFQTESQPPVVTE